MDTIINELSEILQGKDFTVIDGAENWLLARHNGGQYDVRINLNVYNDNL